MEKQRLHGVGVVSVVLEVGVVVVAVVPLASPPFLVGVVVIGIIIIGILGNDVINICSVNNMITRGDGATMRGGGAVVVVAAPYQGK